LSWIQKLYDTYEACSTAPQFQNQPLPPVSHIEQQAHIEIVIDQDGNFERASLVSKASTVVPATEASAGRTGTDADAHPLCDKLQYCAADYPRFGGMNKSFFDKYIKQIRLWQNFDANPKVKAVMRYVESGNVVADLVSARILHVDPEGRLMTSWGFDSPPPQLFKMLTPKPKDKRRDQGDAFVRWRVQIPGDPCSAVWEDSAIRESWIRFVVAQETSRGLCMVTGETAALAASHPKRLRHGADSAKLVSSNDSAGFTFRGRMKLPEEVCGVGSIVTQKAHTALQWLISRQGYHDKASGQVFVAWSVGGEKIPDPFLDTARFFEVSGTEEKQGPHYTGDAGQHFALRLRRAIAGYRAELGDGTDVAVIGLDSATPGRMAITYYRELTGSEFLDRVMQWHSDFAWPQKYPKHLCFVGAPAPRDVALAAYGPRAADSLVKSTLERLLPCIVDARPVPHDLVNAVVGRVYSRAAQAASYKSSLNSVASIRVYSRAAQAASEWEKSLGIACSLFKGSHKEEGYQMSLEETRTSRDYLFGRLLAIADNIEQRALHVADEQRDTNATKLLQRFANHPSSTWRNLELALTSYKSRLRSKRPKLLRAREKLLDSVVGMFRTEDFVNDSKLSAEFLLGFHCQRAALWRKEQATGIDDGAGESFNKGEGN
jgi:CRISPR-associated protein Csd1